MSGPISFAGAHPLQKHIYIESQRIATKIGIGNFTNIFFSMPALTAGGIDHPGKQLVAKSVMKLMRFIYVGLINLEKEKSIPII